MTTTATDCPRCLTRLHNSSDMYGRYRMCVRCGLHEDLDGLPIPGDPTDTLMYVGTKIKWEGMTAGFRQVLANNNRRAVKRAVFCPMLRSNNPCRLQMEPTGLKVPRKLAKAVLGFGKPSMLLEYVCDAGHSIGVKNDYTGFA